MTDRLARQTARQAHQRIAELTRHLHRLEKAITRRSLFVGRCHLCGAPCRPRARHCHAHKWAEGD